MPDGFVNNGSLSGTSTYNNTTLSAMGLTGGTYVYSWGPGSFGAGDTLTLVVTPEPSTFAMVGLIGMAAYGWRKRRKLKEAISTPSMKQLR